MNEKDYNFIDGCAMTALIVIGILLNAALLFVLFSWRVIP